MSNLYTNKPEFLIEATDFGNVSLLEEAATDGKKSWYMRGTCIQGDVRNLNGRIYPTSEIKKAVDDINKRIKAKKAPLGECDHPAELQINLDRVSHVITEMWMDGNNGMGKLRILPTPMGNIIKTFLMEDIAIGVSSRGSGNVDHNGYVDGFEIITIDAVCTPSGPDCYPTPIYETFDGPRGFIREDLARAVSHDEKAQKYLTQELIGFIKSLKY